MSGEQADRLSLNFILTRQMKSVRNDTIWKSLMKTRTLTEHLVPFMLNRSPEEDRYETASLLFLHSQKPGNCVVYVRTDLLIELFAT